MTKNNPYISSSQNVVRDQGLANWGAGSVENLAREPSEPANVLSISLQLFRKRLVYGSRELPLKILKFVGNYFCYFFFLNFDLLLIFLFKIKAR